MSDDEENTRKRKFFEVVTFKMEPELILSDNEEQFIENEIPQKKHRNRFSFEEKASILMEAKNECSNVICQKYGINERTLRQWKVKRDEIETISKKSVYKSSKKHSNTDQLDNEVLSFVLEAKRNGTPLTGAIIQEKAREINKIIGGSDRFKASEGWLRRWKSRKEVQSFNQSGSSSLDSGSETGTGTDTFKRSLSARDSRASSSAGTNKIFPKLGKLGGTIEEPPDVDKEHPTSQTLTVDSTQLQLRRLESYDGGLITQPSHEREILAAVLEVKVDLKLEVQRVNQKLAKIEDMLQTLMNRLPPIGSPPPNAGVQQRPPASLATNGTSVTQSTSTIPVSQSIPAIPGPGNNGAEQKSVTSPMSSSTPSIRESDQVASTSDRLTSKSSEQQQLPQAHHHHHHHHHHHQPIERQKESVSERLSGMADYKSSTREINKELLERLAQVSSSREDTSALGPLILRKRRSKSRGKGVAPLAPLATQPVSPTEATETTQMLESTEDREMSTDRSDRSERSERSERKRPPPRPRDYL